jgi:regulator of protease activity HflC (stomatin/prohibitin superfamily)
MLEGIGVISIVYFILFVIGFGLLSGSVFIVTQKTAVIIERFGRFHSVCFSGLNFKLPIVDRFAAKQNLKIQQLDVDVETKTKDNVFVNAKVSVQYQIIREKAAESYYKLDNPRMQIESYVFDVVRSEIPKLILDDVFSNKDAVAGSIKHALEDSMEGFGYSIRNSLITDLQPEASVKNAMNRINATEREKDAAANEAEAQKIKLVRIAEADAESKRLQGEGLANQRKEIAKGIKESIETIKECGVDEDEVMTLLLVTQHYDAIQDVAKNSVTNTVMLNYSPSGISDVASQIREAVLSVQPHNNAKANGPGRPLLNVG